MSREQKQGPKAAHPAASETSPRSPAARWVFGLVLFAAGAAVGLGGARWLEARGGDAGSAPPPERQEEFLRRQVALAEERCREDAQFRLIQTYRLTEFRRFAELGDDVAAVIGSGAGAARIPRVALDPTSRDEWRRLESFLGGLEGGVDARVFEAFQAVRAFASEHPWPSRTDPAGVARSEWGRPAVVDRWIALNRTLSSRVTAVLGAFFQGG